nr:inner membrane CreD family protein [Chitinophagaceae bacterium]
METVETIKNDTPLWDKGKLFIKSIVIFGIALFLWVPTFFIMGMVREREGRQKEAILDISSKWAGKQTVIGPLLMLPYREFVSQANNGVTVEKHYAYFMADKLEISSTVSPDKRKRGIYEVAVYKSEIKLNGSFASIPWQKLDIPKDQIDFNEAKLVFKIGDAVRGINEDLFVKWKDSSYTFTQQATG